MPMTTTGLWIRLITSLFRVSLILNSIWRYLWAVSFVHGRLPYEVIKPDSLLRSLLRSIPLRKVVSPMSKQNFKYDCFSPAILDWFLILFTQIFTNSDRIHAKKVLDRLGLQDCFDQIVCFETMNPNLPKSTRPDEFPVLLKPSADAMKIAIDAANVNPPRTVLLADWFIFFPHLSSLPFKSSIAIRIDRLMSLCFISTSCSLTTTSATLLPGKPWAYGPFW